MSEKLTVRVLLELLFLIFENLVNKYRQIVMWRVHQT